MAKSYWASRLKLEDRTFDVLVFLFLGFIGIITAYPFLNVLAVSFKNATSNPARPSSSRPELSSSVARPMFG